MSKLRPHFHLKSDVVEVKCLSVATQQKYHDLTERESRFSKNETGRLKLGTYGKCDRCKTAQVHVFFKKNKISRVDDASCYGVFVAIG